MKGSDLTTQTNIVTSTAVPSTVPAEQVESCCSKFDNTKPLRLGLKNRNIIQYSEKISRYSENFISYYKLRDFSPKKASVMAK